MKTPIGLMIVAIGLLHTAFGLWRFRTQLNQMIAEGIIGTLQAPHMTSALPDESARAAALLMTERAFAMWFLSAGLAFIMFGIVVRKLELNGLRPPALLGYALVLFVAVAATISPVSGVWLLLLPAIAIIRTA